MERWIERQGWLEPVGEVIQKVVGGLYGGLGRPGRTLKSLAHGTWPLGHPLHPALTDVPLGAWVVVAVADAARLAGAPVPAGAAGLALLVGCAAAVPAAITGYTDHHETYAVERRVATLHGLLMTLALVLMLASLAIRAEPGWPGRPLAPGISALGLLVALVGAYLGGHLPFGMGTMVNRNAFIHGPEEFEDVAASADLAEGDRLRVQAGTAAVLLVRLGGRLHAISAVCSHAGGPLDEGSLEGDVVTCPWHGSRFCVRDGSVREGPATFAQPRYEVRETGGRIGVRVDPGGGGG